MVDEGWGNPGEYMKVGEAAEYIGVSPQTLRRWDRDGKLVPVRRPRSSYRYYRVADLEPFRLEYRRAEDARDAGGAVFQTANANVEANVLLREPQREAHRHTREHFEGSNDPAIIQLPVGCGKTGVIATLPFGIASGRVLVITPNLTIRKGVMDALDVTNRECFWTKARVLSDFSAGPWTAVLDGPRASVHDAIESNFVVTNIQQLANQADRWLPQFPEDFFDMILVDEGHHSAAVSWQKVFRRFPNAKVALLTATPFRSDQRPLDGEVIYKYSFAKSMMNGFIKHIHSRQFAPDELYFTYRDDVRKHSLEEVLQLREEAWFRRGVALSPECNRHIVEASIQRCNQLRSATGIQHQIVAAACSVDHARQVRAIYAECGYRAAEIHSDMGEDEQEAVLERLRVGQLDCVVQVQMLGEGFDHPRLSVAAIFRPFRSLAPYIQFVGRVMRVVHQDAPDHPDNHGYVVSHVGLNNEARWEEFRELDLDDQALIRGWLEGDDSEGPGEGEAEGEGRPRRFDDGLLVDTEILGAFIDNAFLDPDDDRILDQMLGQPLLGTALTIGDVMPREVLREKLRAALEERNADAPKSIPVQPQRRRRAARDRLAERTGSVAARLLQDLGVSRQGRDVARALRGNARQANAGFVQALLNRKINEFLGIGSGQRDTLTADQTDAALEHLDQLADEIVGDVRAALGSS